MKIRALLLTACLATGALAAPGQTAPPGTVRESGCRDVTADSTGPQWDHIGTVGDGPTVLSLPLPGGTLTVHSVLGGPLDDCRDVSYTLEVRAARDGEEVLLDHTWTGAALAEDGVTTTDGSTTTWEHEEELEHDGRCLHAVLTVHTEVHTDPDRSIVHDVAEMTDCDGGTEARTWY